MLAAACVTFDTAIQQTQSSVSQINVHPMETRWVSSWLSKLDTSIGERDEPRESENYSVVAKDCLYLPKIPLRLNRTQNHSGVKSQNKFFQLNAPFR